MAAAVGDFLGSAFLAPVFLGFLGLIPIVIVLYLLKLRRTEIVIPSTMLWLKSLQDLTANAPFQRLRKNLLLFLQILILLLVVAALARPFVRAEGIKGTNLCVLIDHSASMQTQEGDATRLDLAKEAALEMVDTLRGGDKMMVVAFAEKAQVLCEFTDDRVHLRRAIQSITASDTRTRIRDAMLVARSLVPENPETTAGVVTDLQLILISDGRVADLADLGARAMSLSFLQVGENTNNAGIVAFSVRAPLEGEGEQQTFVLVHNEHTEPLDTTLSLYLNDALLTVDEVHAPPGEDREVVFAHGDLGAGLLRAELDHEDSLPVDNTAWLALRPPATVRVLIVADGESKGAYFLKRVLALDPRVELSAIDPANYGEGGEYDLTIFDGFAPEKLPPGCLLFVNAVPSLPGLRSGEPIENPPVLAWDAEHPTMRFLNPSNIRIRTALRLELPEGSRTLVSTRGGPLLAEVSQQGQQMLVLAFDIGESNWPLRLSFPLFIQNLVAWAPRMSPAGQPSVATGEPLAILPSPEVDQATVTLPDGESETVPLDPTRAAFFGNTKRAGVYQVTRGTDSQQFAVNLLDRDESAVTPAASVSVGRSEVRGERGRIKQNRELWRWLALGALLILAAEWWVYSRRAWA